MDDLPTKSPKERLGRPPFDDVPEGRRRNMKAVRGKHSAAEVCVRRLLHGLGYRYRLHVAHLPGRPDIVLPARRKVIEVRGCFWHRHSDPSCTNANSPSTRADWWAAKLDANVLRDQKNEAALLADNWEVMIVWECETKNPSTLRERLAAFLGPANCATSRQESPNRRRSPGELAP
jgi:DNA mismatch endonuclease Vsr